MKLYLIAATVLITTSAFAGECFKISENPSNIQSLIAPEAICVEDITKVGDKIVTTIIVDGEVLTTDPSSFKTNQIGEDVVMLEEISLIKKEDNQGVCDIFESYTIKMNVVADLAGNIGKVSKVSGVAEMSIDPCHNGINSENFEYQSVEY